MKRRIQLCHEFVEYIPDTLKERTLYVSMKYATVVHKCCCGCGNEVITPLSPVNWQLLFDGKTITLDPSIGNWSLPCQSHYWIINSTVKWARKWTRNEIETEREREKQVRKKYLHKKQNLPRVNTGD